MILIKNTTKKIPSFRHKKILNIYDNSYVFNKNKKKIHNNNYIVRKRLFYNIQSTSLNINFFKHIDVITKKIYYNFKPYKKFIQCETHTNTLLTIPGIEFLNVGKVIYHYDHFKNFKNKFFFKGFIVYVYMIPITVYFSNITNRLNNKITFSKSSGTFCKKKKTKKNKKKLVLVILPSKQEIYINKMCKAYIGKNVNFKVNELVEGKYGYSFYKFKNIKVRGVAMNPVDHPNGGRTKTVQPERSP
jgi:ribosomal protein L2